MARVRPGKAEGGFAAAFRAAWERWLEESCRLFPEQASRLGLHEFDGMLGENTAAVRAEHIQLMEETLAAIEQMPEPAFSGDDRLDRRGLLARLRMDLLFERDLVRWRTNPQVHCNTAVDSVFELAARGVPLKRVLPAIESRLAQIPRYLAAGARCLRCPDPLWTKLAAQSCEGAVEFLEGLAPELQRESAKPRHTASLVRGAAAAFKDFAEHARRLKPGPAGGFAIGRERFEFLIRENLGLTLSLPEARALGEYQVGRHQFLLDRAAKRYGRKAARELIDEAAEAWNPGMPLLEAYRRTTESIKGRLCRAGIVTVPSGDTLRVLPVPPFLRHQFPTAAYSGPEPFARRQSAIFWVNDLSLAEADPAKKRAEVRQHHGLELTCVHEAWPGHHLQFTVQCRHRSRLRRLFAHPIFYEGWTMWCEKTAVETGLVETPRAELVQLHDALWRAHRIVIDCGLQDGSLTHAAAAQRLCAGVGFTPARARADVNWYSSSPSVPMSYLLGRLEVEKLHERLVQRGGWNLKKFNDWMLSHGAIPYSWFSHEAR
jgi:uncharacterized protein (DUF885 family)